MHPVGEQVRLARHARAAQRREEQQAVFHRDGVVVHGVPEEYRRGVGADLVLQAERQVAGQIGRTAQGLKAAPVGKGAGRHHRIGQNQGVGPLPLLPGSLAGQRQHRRRKGQVRPRRKAAGGDLVRQDVPLVRVGPQGGQRPVDLF